MMREPPILTKREQEVLPFLLSGATRAEIARNLGISQETVKLHVRGLLRKFDAENLRDGFEEMSEYQSFYGAEAVAIQYFNYSFDLNIKLIEQGKFARVWIKSVSKLISNDFEGMRYVFIHSENKKTIEYSSWAHQVTADLGFETRHKFTPENKLTPGSLFDWEFELLIDFKDPKALNTYHEFCLIPAAYRKLTIEFDPNDPPQYYKLEVFSGLSVDSNIQLEPQCLKSGAEYLDNNPSTPVKYLFSWQY